MIYLIFQKRFFLRKEAFLVKIGFGRVEVYDLPPLVRVEIYDLPPRFAEICFFSSPKRGGNL